MVEGIQFHSIIQGIFGSNITGLNTESQLTVDCPRCAENYNNGIPDGKQNLSISTSTGMFHCWKCDEPRFSGSLGKLIRLYGTKSDYTLYKSLGGSDFNYNYDIEEDDIPITVDLPEEMIFFSDMNPLDKDHFEAYNYMINDRKIARDILLKYRVGFCITGDYAKRIIIPSYNEFGDTNYFVARSYDPKVKNKFKYKNPEVDKNKIIFNISTINFDSTLFLFEGAFEMLSFPVNSIPMLGKTIYNKLFLKLKEYKPNVVVLLDPDALKNAIELVYKLKNIYVDCEDKVKIVTLPTEEDLDELRKNKGHEEVIKALYSARDLNVDDYFINKLANEKKVFRGYTNNSKYSKW